MLMELRKASNHHLLHRRIFSDAILRQMAKIIVKVMAGNFAALCLLYANLSTKKWINNYLFTTQAPIGTVHSAKKISVRLKYWLNRFKTHINNFKSN